MNVFTPEQHCLLNLSADVWRRRGRAKRHGLLRYNEETASEIFLLDLAIRFPGGATIVPFSRRQEAETGADWAWAFVSSDGKWSQGMLVQAKRLDDQDRKYPGLYYRTPATGSRPSVAQLDRLIEKAASLDLPPVYALYNHLRDPGRLPQGVCGSLRQASLPMPESWGIALASAFAVRAARPDKSYERHREHSLPLHCLLCSGGSGHQGEKGSAGAAARGLRMLFAMAGADVDGDPDRRPPFEPGRELPGIFRYAERIHLARQEGLEDGVYDGEGEYPGIGGAVILRDRRDDGEPDPESRSAG